MIRSIVVHDIPVDSVAAMERWYHRVHAPEIARRYGPWLTRHESFVPDANVPFVLDPTGNLVELVEPLELADHERTNP
jgi:hypothetical protein